MNWTRYRFYTKVEDYRPIKFNPKYPWWCSGFAADESYSVIVAYLPKSESIFAYWPDAYQITSEEGAEIEFSDRFPKPSYFES